MGIVKFFDNSGGTPTQQYANYMLLSGSFADYDGYISAEQEVYIPCNTSQIFDSPFLLENPNFTNFSFSATGQGVQLYVKAISISIASASADDFDFRIFVNGVSVYNTTRNVDGYTQVNLQLPTPALATSSFAIGITNSRTPFKLISCNYLCYSTGNVTPPSTCEYFGLVAVMQQGSVLVCTSPIIGLFRQTPLTFQCVNWRGGITGNSIPRIRNWNNLTSDPTATLIQGQTYYVELTLSQAYGTNKKIYMYFGYDINDRTSTVGIPYFDGNLTTPQGLYLQWNPNSVADPLFMFIGEALPVGGGTNGTLTFKVGTSSCPI